MSFGGRHLGKLFFKNYGHVKLTRAMLCAYRHVMTTLRNYRSCAALYLF